MDDLTKEFLAESSEGLDRMEQCLTDLEQHPRDSQLVAEIFRAVHTIKGATGFLGFARLELLAHAGESLLGSLRDGSLVANETLISGLLKLLDGLRNILFIIDRTGGEGTRDYDNDLELIALLAELNKPALVSKPQDAVVQTPNRELASTVATEPLAARAVADELQAHPEAEKSIAPDRRLEDAQRVAGAAPPNPSINDKTLRIDVEVLNRMMNLVGELVLTRNQILQSHVDAESFPLLARHLDTVTADLRETVMHARTQPVAHLFGKFPRMVRDLAQRCGKQVKIEFSGEGTGLDKSLLEAIKDPLTHAVRNAVDHGIEPPATRLRAGKPAEGVVRLTACHQSGSVLIELSDDGGGIAQRRVLEKAMQRNLITAEQAAQMTPREALQLIFLPGFTTVDAGTAISGRGVGMDVVRANVEGVGGTVEIDSQEGIGTTLRLRVPLTVAIVPALVVRSGGQSFCVPQGSLAELVYIPQREAATATEHIGDAKVYRLRDELLPMVWLDRVLGLDAPGAQVTESEPHGFYLAVLEAEGCRYGLVVDDLMAPEEIVVKPLSSVLREIGLFSGATVLGNGTLALILDVAATAARANVRPMVDQRGIGSASARGNASSAEAAADSSSHRGTSSFLVYEEGGEEMLSAQSALNSTGRERHALPLEVVERIETVRLADVERVSGRWLLQYRGELVQLEDAGRAIEHALTSANLTPLEEKFLTVLICQPKPQLIESLPDSPACRVGVVVDRVLDVTTGSLIEGSNGAGLDSLARVKDRIVAVNRMFSPTDNFLLGVRLDALPSSAAKPSRLAEVA